MLIVAVIVHVLPTELLQERHIIIEVSVIVCQRLAIVQHHAHTVLVLTTALLRRVGSIKGQQAPVVSSWQLTDSMWSTDGPILSQPVQAVKMTVIIVIVIADARSGRDREMLRQAQTIGKVTSYIIVIVRTVTILVALVDSAHLTDGIAVLREAIAIPLAL